MEDKLINLIVVGAGEGFRKLYPVILKMPELASMNVGTVADVVPFEELHEKTRQFLAEGSIHYVDIKRSRIEDIPIGERSAVIIMTPNEFHTPYVKRFFAMKKDLPIDVEKPAATSLADLNDLVDMAMEGRIYAAEPTVDGKWLALLWAAGAIPDDDPRCKYLVFDHPDGNPLYIKNCFTRLGEIRTIDGAMIEGAGTAATADHRAWLLEGNHGGMIRDLASHLQGGFPDIEIGYDFSLDNVELGKYDHGMPLGTWRPLRCREEGETYARIEGKMLAPWGQIGFRFRMGKYATEHKRYLRLDCQNGSAELSFEHPFEFTISLKNGEVAKAKNVLKEYQGQSLLDFERFIEVKTHGHMSRMASIVRFNEAAREFGLERLGL